VATFVNSAYDSSLEQNIYETDLTPLVNWTFSQADTDGDGFISFGAAVNLLFPEVPTDTLSTSGETGGTSSNLNNVQELGLLVNYLKIKP
jgi:hypothetical protein